MRYQEPQLSARRMLAATQLFSATKPTEITSITPAAPPNSAGTSGKMKRAKRAKPKKAASKEKTEPSLMSLVFAHRKRESEQRNSLVCANSAQETSIKCVPEHGT